MDKNAATVADGDDADLDDPLYLLVLYVDKGVKFPSPPPAESSSSSGPSFRLLIRATFESTAVAASAVEWTSSEIAVEREMAWRMKKSALDSYLGDPTKKIHVQVYVVKADAETDEPVLIGEMDQPVAAATPAQIDEGTLNDSRTYKCNWRKLRCKNDGIGNPKLKLALTYEPQTDDLQSTVATDDNDNTLATVKGVDQLKMLQRLTLVLKKEKGYFYLGREDLADRMFQYEVKFIFGKNLHKALTPNFTPPPDPKYQMSYNFLDCDIYSTPFGQLDNPDAVASTATARIRSKAEDFADFAALMSPIPVRLVCGKVNLAVAEIDPSKLLMIVPSDVAGLINGSIEEISRDGTVRFRPFVKDSGETTTPTKRRRTSSVSLTDDPILGFSIAVRYIGASSRVAGADKDDGRMETEVTAENMTVAPNNSAGKATSPLQQQPRSEQTSSSAAAISSSSQYRKSLSEAVAELEEWKLRQKRKFQQELSRLESQQQAVLSAEFKKREESRERAYRVKMAKVDEISDALKSSVEKVSEKEKAVAKREAAVEAREAAVRERSDGARAQSKAASEELRKRAEAAEAKNGTLTAEIRKMTSAMAKLESAAGEGDKARTAAERLRAQVTGLQERNDKYKEDLSTAEEGLRRLQSEKETQMVEQLAESREEIRRLRRQVEAKEARLVHEESRPRPRSSRVGGDGVQRRDSGGGEGGQERRLPGTSDLRASDETGQSLELGDDDEAKRERHEVDRDISRMEKLLIDFKNTGAYTDDDTVVETVRRKLGSLRALKERQETGVRRDMN